MKAVLIALTIAVTGIDGLAHTSSGQGQTDVQRVAPIAGDFASGFSQGLEAHRFIVVFFRDRSGFTTQAEAAVRQLRADPVLSSVFVFTEALLPDDQMGMKAAKQLQVGGVPAISVLAPESTVLREITRFEGVFNFKALHDGIMSDTCKASESGKITLDVRTALVLGCVSR